MEWIIRIRHFLTTDQSFAGKVGCGRYELVDHGIAATARVIAATKFLNLLRSYPGLTFRNVDHHASCNRIAIHSISLHAGFHTISMAPGYERSNKPFLKQLMFRSFKVIANKLSLSREVRRELSAVLSGNCISHLTNFEQDKRKVRSQVISSPAMKFCKHIITPVRPFEFDAISEERTKVLVQRAECG